jgi:hypothetical protein
MPALTFLQSFEFPPAHPVADIDNQINNYLNGVNHQIVQLEYQESAARITVILVLRFIP